MIFERTSKHKGILSVIFLVLLVLGVTFLVWFTFSDQADRPPMPVDPLPMPTEPRPEPMPTEPVFCTQEAMLCPDGSYVGRTGPNCEFTQCPDQILR